MTEQLLEYCNQIYSKISRYIPHIDKETAIRAILQNNTYQVNHLENFNNNCFFQNEKEYVSLMLILVKKNHEFCQFYQFLLDLSQNGLLTDIYRDKEYGKLRLDVYLFEHKANSHIVSEILDKVYSLYGENNLINYLDIVCQILFSLIHYQWTNILQNCLKYMEKITFKIPIKNSSNPHIGQFSYQAISNLIYSQINDNIENKNYIFWHRIFQMVEQYTDNYNQLIDHCLDNVKETIYFITNELKIGNYIEEGQIIDPISHDVINRNIREDVLYLMETSGTIYLFDKKTLKETLLKTGELTNPCTRTNLTINNLSQLGLTKEEIDIIKNKKIEKINENTSNQKN